MHKSDLKRLLCGAAAMALALPMAAHAEVANFNIAAQPLSSALKEFSIQSQYSLVAPPDVVASKTTAGVSESAEPEIALAALLQGTGLSYRREGNTFLIVGADAPQSGSAAGDGAGTVEALIVTAQKKEEAIQDVPIAISAFTEKSLEEQKIEGGFDLLKAIPNVTFSKNNFTSYNFSIRGIGTKAVSATTDPGVAVSFNNIALIQNRLFEQEYFDVERVEVLRGPQGTLYGRNATAGVINVISAKPNMTEFSGWLKGEVGNYHSKRLSAMVNVPLVEDKLAIRIAGALTDRQGYDFNEITKHPVNGRDLWSGRVTIAFNPTEQFRSNLIWERFNEDDNRSRTGKQLCHRDPSKMTVGSVSTQNSGYSDIDKFRGALLSQGCRPGSLYDDAAFGTPNGLALPFVFAEWTVHYGLFGLGCCENGGNDTLLKPEDPYGGMMQSRDLRNISSIRDPKYRAQADIVELNFDLMLGDSLTLTSQTAYDRDKTYSFQDYNRFNTGPVFNDTSGFSFGDLLGAGDFRPYANLAPGGVFCDPQIGCSNRLAGFDIAQANSEQLSQEIRVVSNFQGPVNFSAGATYTRFKVEADYYVMYNLLTALALTGPFNGIRPYGNYLLGNTTSDITQCGWGGFIYEFDGPLDINDPRATCPYIDPNPVESINGEGHNYFRSKNPYRLRSAAAFGELYVNVAPELRVTVGLRYNDDHKTFVPVPSQLLLSTVVYGGGYVNRGYPERDPIKQHWGEWTGRLGFDWKPALSFTDQTLVYASYARGYKGGGANPPSPGFATREETAAAALASGTDPNLLQFIMSWLPFPLLKLTAVEYGRTFRPEFVNAFEVGTKNTLMGGALTVNGGAFFYDYHDYQVSQIRDRTAVNENFDAKIWGLELQTVFAPKANFQILANVGYLDTRIGNGMRSIDIMNRTQSNPGWVVVKPWMQFPSNCIVPVGVAENWAALGGFGGFWMMCGGLGGFLGIASPPMIDPATGQFYDVNNYPEANGGAGLYADLGGKELPNSPHWTANLGAQYSIDFANSWKATIRADGYWQSQSWARVYNAVNDKLHGWYNANLSLWVENDDGLKIELYAKNILDKSPITDAFINSDDTGLTTNVFTLDPRLIGLSIKKDF